MNVTVLKQVKPSVYDALDKACVNLLFRPQKMNVSLQNFLIKQLKNILTPVCYRGHQLLTLVLLVCPVFLCYAPTALA